MGVARAYKAGTPYNGSELSELSYEQTTDTLYIAHIDHEPAKIVRSAHTTWTHSDITFGPVISAPTGVGVVDTEPNTDSANSGDNYFPQPDTYVVTSVDDETGEESRASSEVSATNDLTLKRNYNTVSWTGNGSDRYNVYKAHNDQFFGYIGTTDNTSFRDDNIGPALDNAPPNAENPFSGAGNNPSTVALFEQRLIWARTTNGPNAAWGSRIGIDQLENMDRSRPARADDAFSMAIVSRQVNPINQLVATTGLTALTSHAIFGVDGDGAGGVIVGNSPPSIDKQVTRGATRTRAIPIDNVLFYESSVGYSVRALGYNFEFDGNTSNDISIFSPHFFTGFDIVEWAYAAEPRSIIWAVRSDGKLLAFTWEQEQSVWGWTICETDGLYKSVAVVTEAGEDRAYFIVERVINGATKRFIERMAPHEPESLEKSVFLDCSVSGSFTTAVSQVANLWHLEGATNVAASVDGAYYTGLTVTGGVLTLPTGVSGNLITVGLQYDVVVETLPVRVTRDSTGSNLGRQQQPGDVVLHLKQTSDIKVGIDENHLYGVRQDFAEIDAPLGVIDGVTEPIPTDNKAGNETAILIKQTLPAPFTLLGIGVDPIINE